jgi:hypothetical protein
LLRANVENIPFYSSTILFTKRLRFKVAGVAASNSAFTNEQLLDLLCFFTDATTAFRMCESIRLKKVEVWSSPQTDTSGTQSPVTVAVEFRAGSSSLIGGRNVRVSDTVTSPAHVAHVKAVPRPEQFAAMWQSGTNETSIFQLTAPLESIVDLTLDMVLRDDGTVQAISTSVSGGTAGQQGILGITSGSTAAASLTPVDWFLIA